MSKKVPALSLSATGLPAITPLPATALAKTVPTGVDALVIPLFSTPAKPTLEIALAASEGLPATTAQELLHTFEILGATGASGELTLAPAPSGSGIILGVGLGTPEELDDETLRRAAGSAARSLFARPQPPQSIAVTLAEFGTRAVVEGFLLGAYSYPGIRHSSAPANNKVATARVTFIASAKGAKKQFTTGVITAESVALARDLVNTPANYLYPEAYATALSELAKQIGVSVEVLNEQELARQGFGGILAVGAGSAHAPRLVRLSYQPQSTSEIPKIALVGKGITFDTGGISIKPAAKMENMISDMGGSAAVAATVFAAARLNLNVEVTATLPLAENMPSGTATRPGDVICHYGGITSEVINTDAEGRLVLADAIARATEDAPDYLLETATLTGAQLVALGDRTAGVMGSPRLRDLVTETGRAIGEHAWAMPLLEELAESLKSPIADIRNAANSRNGGMIYAAHYLSRFVAEGVEWAHIDVAGPAWNEGAARGYTPQRATGVPVRTFLAVLESLS